MTRLDDLNKKIAELEEAIANGDGSRLSELRLESFKVLRDARVPKEGNRSLDERLGANEEHSKIERDTQ